MKLTIKEFRNIIQTVIKEDPDFIAGLNAEKDEEDKECDEKNENKKFTVKEIRSLIRNILKESDVAQSVSMSAEVDQATKSLINAAAMELRDLDPQQFQKLAGNKQGIAALKNAVSAALRKGLGDALNAAPKPAAPAAPPGKPQVRPGAPQPKSVSHSGQINKQN